MYTKQQIESARKQWLISFLMDSFLVYLPSLIMSSDLTLRIIPGFDLSISGINIESLSFYHIITAKLLFFCVMTWLVYFFAYKTRGIKLLSCIWFFGGLIFAILQFYSATWLLQCAANSGVYSFHVSFETGLFGLQSLMDAYYIYCSYQLFCVNKYLLYKDDDNVAVDKQ